MQGIEQLIRESLTARAQDVETTPMLWLEVDRRVARRKRFQVTAWSLAGATAALAAVFAVPAIVGLIQGDPRDIDIAPMDRTPVAGVVPELYVTDIDGRLQIRDIETGEVALPAGDGFELPANEIEVRPGSTGTGYSILSTHGGDGTQPGFLAVVDSAGDAPDASATTLPAYEAAPDFTPSVVWAPDQDAAAITLPMPEADQTNVVLWSTPDANEDIDPRELALVLGEGEVELLDWVGQTTTSGDVSVLFYRDDLGVHSVELTVAEDGSMTTDEHETLDGVHDVASSHAWPGAVDPPLYSLLSDDRGDHLRWQEGNTISEYRLEGHLDLRDPDTLWIDAKQDAVIVGDATRTLLFTHDGDGNWVHRRVDGEIGVPYVELDAGSVTALFDAPRPGELQPTPSEPSAEDPSEEPAPEPTQEGETAAGDVLPEPVITATIRDLVLHGPDGEQVLYTLPQEGESSFLSVAVRPGSTVDDLTILALHRAEGMQDFRTYRYVDGELSVEYWDRQDLQPGFGGGSGDAVAAFGPVWHPAGDKFAWIEMGTSGVPNLRIIGWTDDRPGTGNTADDNTSFTLDEFEGIVVEPLDWVDLGGGQTEVRAVAEDFFDSWITIPIEIQGDNAAAMSGSAEFSSLAEGGEGRVGGVAGQNPRWLLQGDTVHLLDDRSVSVTLPPEFFPGEGIPDTWMREIGDGVLVGISNTGLAYYVTADGDLARVGEDPWMHGDVVD